MVNKIKISSSWSFSLLPLLPLSILLMPFMSWWNSPLWGPCLQERAQAGVRSPCPHCPAHRMWTHTKAQPMAHSSRDFDIWGRTRRNRCTSRPLHLRAAEAAVEGWQGPGTRQQVPWRPPSRAPLHVLLEFPGFPPLHVLHCLARLRLDSVMCWCPHCPFLPSYIRRNQLLLLGRRVLDG